MIALVVVLALQTPEPTSAPTPPTPSAPTVTSSSPEQEEQARALYVAGSAAYEKGQYLTSIAAFDEVVKLVHRPAAWFSLAQSCRLQFFVDDDLHKLERAIVAYKTYLEQDPTGPRRDHAAEHLSVLVPLLERRRLESADGAAKAVAPARVIVSADVDGATASVDGGPAQSIPATFEVAPGRRVVVVEAPQHQRQERSTVAVAGAVVALDVDLVAVPGRIAVDNDDGGVVRVDGALQDGAEFAVSPGVHHVVVTGHGRQAFSQSVDVAPAGRVVVDASLPFTSLTTGALVGLGVGGVVVVAAAVPAVAALAVEDEAARTETAMQLRALSVDEADRYRSLRAERDVWSRTALAIAGVGGAIVVASAVALAVDGGEEP